MYLTGYENLQLMANLYKGIDKKRIDKVVRLVKLENRINDKVSKYSLGMRQRLGIAQAILHKPTLLILDEPTNGLDPEGIKEMRELLLELAKKEGMGILISSHNLSEIDKGTIEASKAMGASNWQIIMKVLIPEAKPALVSSITVMGISLVGYTAMAGCIGAGGLGNLAYMYGYVRQNMPVMYTATFFVLVIVFMIQIIGDLIVKKIDKR